MAKPKPKTKTNQKPTQPKTDKPPLQPKDTQAIERTSTKNDDAGNLEDALSQLQLLKEDSALGSSESFEIIEDNAFAIRRKHQMAQAMMHVIDFDPNWRVSTSVPQNSCSTLTNHRKPFRA
jgi:hypothetical protein